MLGETAWHSAGINNNKDVLEKLWGFAKEIKLNRNELQNALLLARQEYRYITWLRAAANEGNVE